MSALETNRETKCNTIADEHHVGHKKLGQDGWPDQQYFWGKGRIFYVEFKKDKNSKHQPMQPVIKKMLESWGYEVHIIWTTEQFRDVIARWEMLYGFATAKRPA